MPTGIDLVPMCRSSVARAVTVAAALAVASTPVAAQIAPQSCGVSAPESRWLADSYHETHSYGLGGEEEWIGSYGGLVSSGDSLFLYDQLRPRIVHLSGDLQERHAFGRQGEGPGEFNWAVPVTWIDDLAEGHVAFDGRNLVVYDRNDVAVFDAEGEFRWSTLVPTRTVFRYGVQFVTPVDQDEMILGVDSLAAGRRRLQLWRVERPESDQRELLWERIAFTRAPDDRFPNSHQREAQPYWARHQDCIVVSDGGGQFLWVVDLSTLRTDSVPLPEWKVPKFGELPSDFSVLNLGGRELSKPQEPTLLWRWSGLLWIPMVTSGYERGRSHARSSRSSWFRWPPGNRDACSIRPAFRLHSVHQACSTRRGKGPRRTSSTWSGWRVSGGEE